MDAKFQLNVGSVEQKIAFLYEMQGQISDGQWENASPQYHYTKWMELGWENVNVTPNNIGRNFYTPKDNYNFTNIELLDIVAERIIYKINLYRDNQEVRQWVEDKRPYSIPDGYREWKIWEESTGYCGEIAAEMRSYGITNEMMDRAQNGSYTRKQLVADLNVLKKACRHYITTEPLSVVVEEKPKVAKVVRTVRPIIPHPVSEVQADIVSLKNQTFRGIPVVWQDEGIYICRSVGAERKWIRMTNFDQLEAFMKADYTPKYISKFDLV